MSQQPTWAAVESAIQSVVQAASGLTTIWSWQNYDAPDLSYVRIALGAATTVGIDWIAETPVPAWAAATAYTAGDRVANDGPRTYLCTVSGTSAASGGPTGVGSAIIDGSVTWSYVSAASGIALTVGGVREVPLQIEAFSAATVEEVNRATALSIVDGVVTKLRLPTARDALAAVGVTPFDPGPTNYVPDVVSVGFRGRAVCDVRCRMPARAIQEFANFIASISLTAGIGGTANGVDISLPITAP